jgi:hypothetical protein
MRETNDGSALPQPRRAAAVARALGCTERYVREKARLREWPHRRLARNEVRFSAGDYGAVLELIRVQPAVPMAPRLALAPRSARRLAARRIT